MSRLLALFGIVAFVSPALCQPSEPKPGEVRKFEIARDVFMEFCWIPPGEAQLGSPKEEQDNVTERFYNDDEAESKRGKFKTRGFWLGKYTVTQAEWKAVMGNNPSIFDGTNNNEAKGLDTSRFPVEAVSWDDSKKFLEKVNERGGVAKVFGTDGKFMLPHEDQWEYACRGGKGNKQAFYWGNELNGTQANCNGDYTYGTTTKGQYLGRTCAVDFTNGGKYEKHPWGLCHMSGNVWQWCENKYKNGGSYRVARGGCWFHFPRECRSANRDGFSDYARFGVLGFRVALVPSGQ
jgi:formylglycine-generating enzyme required for sulfatase activity